MKLQYFDFRVWDNTNKHFVNLKNGYVCISNDTSK